MPLSSENPELRISLGNSNEVQESPDSQQGTEINAQSPESESPNQNHEMYGEQSIFMNQTNNKPSENKSSKPSPEPEPIPSDIENSDAQDHQEKAMSSSNGDWDQSIQKDYDQKEFLEEIDPAPFDNSYLGSSSKKDSNTPEQPPSQSEQNISRTNGTQATVSISPEKRKRLEKDMKNVLSFLTEKLPNVEDSIEKDNERNSRKRAQVEQKIEPETINDILKQLSKIDKNIEASAIIKQDGKKLASAISNRISDPLFWTIGQNLSMIGSDIINGLNAGSLRSISVRGTEGILDLAPLSQDDPILKNFLLIIFSNPNVKSGMVQIAIRKISSQLKEFL